MQPDHLNPGDVLICAGCGARSLPLWHTGAQHRPGWPLLASWPTEKGHRHLVVNRFRAERPWNGLCPACPEREVAELQVERAEVPANHPPVPLSTSPAVAEEVRHADAAGKAGRSTPAPPPVSPAPASGQLGLFG